MHRVYFRAFVCNRFMDFWLQKSEFNALQLVTNSEERDLETKVHTLKRLHVIEWC